MSDFANQIQVFRRKVEARLSEAVRKVTFELHSMIVQRTPGIWAGHKPGGLWI